MLSNVLKRCEDLRIIPSDPSTMMTISNDSIATTDWQEMSIFEKVTVLRALCDARLNKADIDQVTEVNRSLEIHRKSKFCFECRICRLIRFDSNRSAKILVAIRFGISATRDFTVIQ